MAAAKKALTVAKALYRFDLDPSRKTLSLSLADGGGPLFSVSPAFLLVPEIPGTTAVLRDVSGPAAFADGSLRLLLRGRLAGTEKGVLENEIWFLADRVVCRARYRTGRPHALHGWRVVPPGTRLGAATLQAYLGQHGQPGDGRVLPLDDSWEISTLSHNWTYCTLAPRVVLSRGRFSAAIGGTTPAHDYGFTVAVKKGAVERFAFDYGSAVNPFPAGADWQDGPRLQIQAGMNRTAHEAHAAFTGAMAEDGLVAAKRYRPEDRPWFRPWYCTWGDQMLLSRAGLSQDVSRDEEYALIKNVLTQEWCLRTARKIRAMGLNVGTFIIDDGWQDTRGDWNLVRERFPDMRAMVDELHGMDFKVVLWWAPLQLDPTAAVMRDPGLVSGPDRSGQVVMDYSKPAAREQLRRRLRLWFGAGPAGWNIDGFKLDFFMEKVSPYTQGGDPALRGEERVFLDLIRTVREVAGEENAAPGLLAFPYNPHLVPYLTTVFLEERFDTDFSTLYEKRPIADAMIPGMRLTAHFNYNPDAVPEYLEMCRAMDVVPQIGVVHGTAEDYRRLRAARNRPWTDRRRVTPADLRALLAPL